MNPKLLCLVFSLFTFTLLKSQTSSGQAQNEVKIVGGDVYMMAICSVTGEIWAAQLEGLTIIKKGQKSKQYRYNDGFTGCEACIGIINSMDFDDFGNLWAIFNGQNGQHLIVFDRALGRFVDLEEFSSGSIHRIVKSPAANEIYFSSKKGLVSFEPMKDFPYTKGIKVISEGKVSELESLNGLASLTSRNRYFGFNTVFTENRLFISSKYIFLEVDKATGQVTSFEQLKDFFDKLNGNINSAHADYNKGIIWFVVSDGLLVRWDLKEKPEVFPTWVLAPKCNGITTIHAAKMGLAYYPNPLWIGCGTNKAKRMIVLIDDDKNGNFKTQFFEVPNDQIGLNEPIHSIYSDPKSNEIWIASASGLFFLELKNQSNFSPDPVNDPLLRGCVSEDKSPDEVITYLREIDILPKQIKPTARASAGMQKQLLKQLANQFLKYSGMLFDLSGSIPIAQQAARCYSVDEINRAIDHLNSEFEKFREDIEEKFRIEYRYTPNDPKFIEWENRTPVTNIFTQMEIRKIKKDWDAVIEIDEKFEKLTIDRLIEFRDSWVKSK